MLLKEFVNYFNSSHKSDIFPLRPLPGLLWELESQHFLFLWWFTSQNDACKSCETQSHFFGTLLQKAVSKLRISAWVHSLSSLAERIFFRAENRERGPTPFFAFPLFNLRCTFCRWIAERKKTKLEIKWIVVLQSGSTILYRSWSGERVAGGILSPSPCVITSDWISSPFPFSRFASDFQLQGVSKRISPRFGKNIRIRI